MININNKDLFWNYTATVLKIGSSVLLMPLILNKMSSQSVGIWNIFISISFFLTLVDFGFNASFTRNLTYIFSGANELLSNGYSTIIEQKKINYNLLSEMIITMRGFYFKLAIIVFLFLSIFGTFYILFILRTYQGNIDLILISWFLFIIVNTYNLYTLYYESLLLGSGLIKQSKQLIIIGQASYLLIAGILILFDFDLLSIVIGQFISVLIVRILSKRLFFTKNIKALIQKTSKIDERALLKLILPNAIKIGLTSFGGFLVQRSAIIIGSLFLSLEEIGSYGVTLQIINLMATLSLIYQSTFLTKINQLRIIGDINQLKEIHIKSKLIYFLTFIFGSLAIYFMAPWLLIMLKSKTYLVNETILIMMFLIAFIENNIIMSSNIILSKNVVPFYKASLISGFLIVIFLILFFQYTHYGILNLVIVPLIIDLFYQGWKWPIAVVKDLNITLQDYQNLFRKALKIDIK
jgi:O-antigen/teichoic acid export membrane protein